MNKSKSNSNLGNSKPKMQIKDKLPIATELPFKKLHERIAELEKENKKLINSIEEKQSFNILNKVAINSKPSPDSKKLLSIPQIIENLHTVCSCMVGNANSTEMVNQFLNPGMKNELLEQKNEAIGILQELNELLERFKQVEDFQRQVNRQLYINSGYSNE